MIVFEQPSTESYAPAMRVPVHRLRLASRALIEIDVALKPPGLLSEAERADLRARVAYALTQLAAFDAALANPAVSGRS
jgi:hypothetical protein